MRQLRLTTSCRAVDSPTFPELADDLAKRHHREILMDKAYETSHDKDDALSLLREHITNNLIKVRVLLQR